jgi:DNA-binding PadR family transcriptional regulator
MCYSFPVLEFAILGLLMERTMHGYDLRRRLREDFGPLANLSFGSLYPALARLEASGAIAVVVGSTGNGTLADGFAPMATDSAVLSTGSLGGERATTVARRATAKVAETLGGRGTRGSKVYEITPAGKDLFAQLLETPPTGDSDPRGFSLRLAFARHLSPQARIRLLERRRMELTDRLRQSSINLASPTRSLDPYERSLAEHARESVASDLTWIEGLLEAELHAIQPPLPSPAGDLLATTGERIVNPYSQHAREGVAMTNDGGSTP